MPPSSLGSAIEVAAPSFEAVLDDGLEPARKGFLARGSGFQSHASAVTLLVNGQRVTHTVFAVAVLPGDEVTIEVIEPDQGHTHVLRYSAGRVSESATAPWKWTAPSTPGAYALRIERDDGAFVHVNALVHHPRSLMEDGYLNGFRIGTYRSGVGRSASYQPPRGFFEVSREDQDILLSPHFTVGQFLCKQPGEPAYVAFSPPLMRKLEALLGEVNRAGYEAESLHVMSGFRTPWYNRSIGNRTTLSRHLWGDAADVFIDRNGDGEMDDLNGDGRVDYRDADVLSRIVDRLDRERPGGLRQGGLSIYRRNAVRGPFVHVDARGTTARW